jgi:hypothetical protein
MDAKTALQGLIAEAIAAGYLDPDTLEPVTPATAAPSSGSSRADRRCAAD